MDEQGGAHGHEMESCLPDISTIDALLERYLVLLDEYTTLRAELSRLQASAFQHLARANFSAERGVRYGADFFDERMQAVRTVAIEGPAGSTFRVVKAVDEAPAEPEAQREAAGEQVSTEKKKKTPKPGADPLRWFGVLTPSALRQTQACAVEAVEGVVSRLVTVDAEMRSLEIEVRRARKKRAKAEAAAAKDVALEPETASRGEVAVS